MSILSTATSAAPLHTIDLIRKKRDGGALDAREIGFLAAGAADGTIPLEQLSAWLMAAYLRGLTLDETRALTVAMRDSGEKFDPSRLGKAAVDKHSTGGVGDKTSFLVAPLAAACGLAVPMISGRALGHTGGTLDKLEAIPGYRTALTLSEFETVLRKCGASIVSQTPALVPADRVLYALRDRTGTVESPGLICASILSKKLAAGVDALVLDVKTGSGAFLRKREEAEYLAALMVATAEGAGTRTVALLTDMGQPLGSTAGNWIELAECIDLLRGERPAESEDLRELSLILAGWMICLGGKAESPEAGSRLAEDALANGSGLRVFLEMIEAQGGGRDGVRRSEDDPQARSDADAGGMGERVCRADGHDRDWLGRAAAGRGTREGRRAGRSSCRNSVSCAARSPDRARAAAGHPLCDGTGVARRACGDLEAGGSHRGYAAGTGGAGEPDLYAGKCGEAPAGCC